MHGLRQEWYVKVYARENGHHGYDFFADSGRIVDCFLFVDFDHLENLRPSVPMPFARAVPAGARELFLFTLHPEGRGRRSYRLRHLVAQGNPDSARHDDAYGYLFPYEHGTKHRVTQGYGGKFTHFGENRFALDFDLDVGTPVFAARGGTVVETRGDSSSGGPSEEFETLANYILIAHADGSFGNYVHLKRKGVLVEPGDTVRPGEIIGYSGNTGRSSGPHLHFDVRVPTRRGRMQTIPVKFLLPTGYPAASTDRTGSTGSRRNGASTQQEVLVDRETGRIAHPLRRSVDPVREAEAQRGEPHPGRVSRASMWGVYPQEGEFYYAYHPGWPPFKLELGSALRPEMYETHVVRIQPDDLVALRIERVDHTAVVFARNGRQTGVEIEVSMTLHGMASTSRLPCVIRIPARTEGFVTLLRPVPGARHHAYSYRLQVRRRWG